jgi:hypothetical protein
MPKTKLDVAQIQEFAMRLLVHTYAHHGGGEIENLKQQFPKLLQDLGEILDEAAEMGVIKPFQPMG